MYIRIVYILVLRKIDYSLHPDAFPMHLKVMGSVHISILTILFDVSSTLSEEQ